MSRSGDRERIHVDARHVHVEPAAKWLGQALLQQLQIAPLRVAVLAEHDARAGGHRRERVMVREFAGEPQVGIDAFEDRAT